jgi:streptomycin 6-kinase
LTPAFYCTHWNLVPDGAAIATPSSLLLPELTFAGLSASWHLADGTAPALDLEIALAAGLLRS